MMRNPLQPYSPGVLVATFALLAFAIWCFVFAWDLATVQTWEGRDDG